MVHLFSLTDQWRTSVMDQSWTCH